MHGLSVLTMVHLTVRGLQLYLVLVERKECNCEKCICKCQFSCANCKCCLSDHIYNPRPVTIQQQIKTEIVIEQ